MTEKLFLTAEEEREEAKRPSKPLRCTRCGGELTDDLIAIVRWNIHGWQSWFAPSYGNLMEPARFMGIPTTWMLCKNCIIEIFRELEMKRTERMVKDD